MYTKRKNETSDSPAVIRHGIKYLFVGACSAAIELLVFQGAYALTPIGLAPSNVLALSCSTIFNFLMNRNFTFKSTSNPLRSLILYLVLFAFNTAVTTGILSVLVNDFSWPSIAAKLLTMACVVSWNFVLYRTIIFK